MLLLFHFYLSQIMMNINNYDLKSTVLQHFSSRRVTKRVFLLLIVFDYSDFFCN